ncbi:MAG: hypothetical protein AB7T10_00930 [bacterium]
MKIALCALFLITSLTLFAHGPSSIDLTINDSLNLLYVKVYHNVPSVTAHYIKSIKLIVNGKDLIDERFSRQSSKEFEEAYFLYAPSQTDTSVEISASCNIFGGKKTKLSSGGEK